jgi:hypothetical protein
VRLAAIGADHPVPEQHIVRRHILHRRNDTAPIFDIAIELRGIFR